MSSDLRNWTKRALPQRQVLEGAYVRLEPLDSGAHGDGLHAASTVPDADTRFRYLMEYPPESRAAFQSWLDWATSVDHTMMFAVIDKASGQVAGRQGFLRMEPGSGVIEIGHVYWGPLVSRKPAATEALYLFARHVFEDLGYRRFEWKCNALNAPSRRAAERFGFSFEGIFRQMMVVKGENRDTAWFSIIDSEWPALARAYQTWLAPENFDAQGQQKRTLEACRAAI